MPVNHLNLYVCLSVAVWFLCVYVCVCLLPAMYIVNNAFGCTRVRRKDVVGIFEYILRVCVVPFCIIVHIFVCFDLVVVYRYIYIYCSYTMRCLLIGYS